MRTDFSGAMSVFKAQIVSLSALLMSVASIQLATTALTTVIALLIASEGGTQEAVAVIAAAYSAGFLFGCFHAAEQLARVGHIRAFSAAAAICTIATLAITATSSVVLLAALRFVMGVATASLTAIPAAWIHESTTRENRGRILSVYSVTIGMASIFSQIVVFAFSERIELSFTLFACLFSAAVAILALARTEPPGKPNVSKVSLVLAFKTAPIAAVGSLVSGIAVTTLLTIAPFYFSKHQVSAGIIALALGSFYLGRMVLQLPLGYLSDKIDRRFVILAATTVGAIIMAAMVIWDPGDARDFRGELGRFWQVAAFGGCFILGGCLLSLYSLATAHALDRANADQMTQLTTSNLLIWSIGSMIGPIITALMMQFAGVDDMAIYYFLLTILVAYIIYIVLRLAKRAAAPREQQVQFVNTPTSSVVMAQAVAERQVERAPASK